MAVNINVPYGKISPPQATGGGISPTATTDIQVEGQGQSRAAQIGFAILGHIANTATHQAISRVQLGINQYKMDLAKRFGETESAAEAAKLLASERANWNETYNGIVEEHGKHVPALLRGDYIQATDDKHSQSILEMDNYIQTLGANAVNDNFTEIQTKLLASANSEAGSTGLGPNDNSNLVQAKENLEANRPFLSNARYRQELNAIASAEQGVKEKAFENTMIAIFNADGYDAAIKFGNNPNSAGIFGLSNTDTKTIVDGFEEKQKAILVEADTARKELQKQQRNQIELLALNENYEEAQTAILKSSLDDKLAVSRSVQSLLEATKKYNEGKEKDSLEKKYVPGKIAQFRNRAYSLQDNAQFTTLMLDAKIAQKNNEITEEELRSLGSTAPTQLDQNIREHTSNLITNTRRIITAPVADRRTWFTNYRQANPQAETEDVMRAWQNISKYLNWASARAETSIENWMVTNKDTATRSQREEEALRIQLEWLRKPDSQLQSEFDMEMLNARSR